MSMLGQKAVMYPTLGVGIVAGLAYFKDSHGGKNFNKEIKAEGKTFIVTGATSGIGEATVRELVKRGGKVYMLCRDLRKCEKIRKSLVTLSSNRYVYCRKCDLSSFQSIQNFVKVFKEEQDRLDVLINNAGVMACPRNVTKDGIEMQLGVNHMGHFLLTMLLLDMLKKSQPSRIINVTSISHAKGKIHKEDLNLEKNYDPMEAYNQSKLANVLFTNELAMRLQDTKVTANCVNPGITDTEINRNLPIRNSLSYYWYYPLAWPFIKSPYFGAQTVLYAALEPSIEKVTGEYFVDCEKGEVADNAIDYETGKWLWAVSEKWTKIKDLQPAPQQKA